MFELLHNLFGLDYGHIVHWWKLARKNFCLAVALDFLELVYFFSFYKCKRHTCTSCTPCPANAVYIVLVILRQIVVKYRFYVVDINTPCCHICRDQYFSLAIAEIFHDPVTLRLLHISMKSLCKIAAVWKFFCQLVHASFCITKNQRQLWIIIIQQTRQHIYFIAALCIVIILFNAWYGQFFFYDLDCNCIVLVFSRNLQNRLWHCRWKKHRLMLSWNIVQNRLDILSKSHVQHFVCFIQNNRIDLLTADRLSAQMIHNTSRRAYNNLAATL